MIHHRHTTVCLVAAAIAVAIGCAESPEPEPVFALPQAAAEIDGWRLDGEPAVYPGETLFEMINGGAELYHQLGFVQALAAEYVDTEGRTIALEVFEMTDTDAAAAIFAEKAGGSGEPAAIGDEASVESYYMNARTGPYLITITGFESDDATSAGILDLVRAVAAALGGRQ